jgi:hypothetical protein
MPNIQKYPSIDTTGYSQSRTMLDVVSRKSYRITPCRAPTSGCRIKDAFVSVALEKWDKPKGVGAREDRLGICGDKLVSHSKSCIGEVSDGRPVLTDREMVSWQW